MSYPKLSEPEFPEGWESEIERKARMCKSSQGDLATLSSRDSYQKTAVMMVMTMAFTMCQTLIKGG